MVGCNCQLPTAHYQETRHLNFETWKLEVGSWMFGRIISQRRKPMQVSGSRGPTMSTT
jgi:hypothetical protein